MQPPKRHKSLPNHAVMWRSSGISGLELMRARFSTHKFARHSHSRYGIGIIEQGAMAFKYMGGNLVAAQGQINTVIPGEVHDGQALSRYGWRYRMLYLEPEILESAATQISPVKSGPPIIPSGVIDDPVLFGRLNDLHYLMEEGKAPLLERQSQLLDFITGFIIRHAEGFRTPARLKPAPLPAARAKDYIHDNSALNPSLKEVSLAAGLSPFHLLRVFARAYGLTPHAYLIQTRVKKARGLLAGGFSTARAAYETGFCDQSHLTRHFKRIYGATPGQYRRNVRA